MPEILVTAAQVKAKAEELRTMNEQFKSMVSELESQEVDLNSMWEGQMMHFIMHLCVIRVKWKIFTVL